MKFYIIPTILIILFTFQLLSTKTDILWSKPHNPLDSADEATNLNAIIPDFQVNENTGPAGASQSAPSISSDESGNFVITWTDYRNGDWDIYAQRYSSDGSAIGTNFKVSDDQGSADQWYPSISSDGSGNFVITWRDNRNDDGGIYAQRYSSDGSAMNSNFRVPNTN